MTNKLELEHTERECGNLFFLEGKSQKERSPRYARDDRFFVTANPVGRQLPYYAATSSSRRSGHRARRVSAVEPDITLIVGNDRLCPQYPATRAQGRVCAIPCTKRNGTLCSLRHQGKATFHTKKLVANRRVGWRQSASTCVRLGITNPPHMITQVSIGGLVIHNWFSTLHPTDTPTHPTPDSQGMAASARDARFFVNPQYQTTTLLLSNRLKHLLPGQSFRAHGKAGNCWRKHAWQA